MSVNTHRLLDVLRGVGREELLRVRGEVCAETRAELLRVLPTAEKLDVVNLPLEPTPGRPGWVRLPELTEDEVDMWRHGLLPLPAADCWFEFDLGGGRTGLLVRQLPEGGVRCLRVDYMTAESPRKWFLDGIRYTLHPERPSERAGDLPLTVDADRLTSECLRDSGEEDSTFAIIKLVPYFALMLCSRTTEVHDGESAQRKLTYTERRKGVTPEHAHSVVDVAPRRYAEHAGTDVPGGSGERSPPRLHWRRSHLRRYTHQTAHTRWCPALTGPDGVPGCWAVVIARQLVGRADLGEVTHEYRVSGGGAP